MRSCGWSQKCNFSIVYFNSIDGELAYLIILLTWVRILRNWNKKLKTRWRLWRSTSRVGNTTTLKKVGWRLSRSRKSMKKEFSQRCIKNTKDSITMLWVTTKIAMLPSINSGTTLKTRSKVIWIRMKVTWSSATTNKLRTPRRILMCSSHPKSRKAQNCLIWGKWRSTWSSKRCTLKPI